MLDETLKNRLMKFFEEKYLDKDFENSLIKNKNKNDMYELITDIFVIGYYRGYDEGRGSCDYSLEYSEWDMRQAFNRGYNRGQEDY